MEATNEARASAILHWGKVVAQDYLNGRSARACLKMAHNPDLNESELREVLRVAIGEMSFARPERDAFVGAIALRYGEEFAASVK